MKNGQRSFLGSNEEISRSSLRSALPLLHYLPRRRYHVNRLTAIHALDRGNATNCVLMTLVILSSLLYEEYKLVLSCPCVCSSLFNFVHAMHEISRLFDTNERKRVSASLNI
jgi:hypothetical protein